ncbi:concanavalin A-like lectin/glucanase domain-containing protein [Russula emetica]|nr:concanavalin A-like lectin/glucanase domain-containing protein [Russula emetica]
MRSLPIAVLFSLVSLVAASNKRGHTLRYTHARSTSRCHVKKGGKQNQTVTNGNRNHTVTKGTGYRLVDQYKGRDFLDEARWSASTEPDATHGLVQYVSQDTAQSEGMTKVLPNGAAILSVNNKTDLPLNTPRQSMHIMTTKRYNGGLFIADFQRMPFGCSLWPAYWSFGAGNWPEDGEIDILEGVNKQATNQMTLHTGPHCSLDENPKFNSASEGTFLGNVLSRACASSPSDNAGCGISDPDPSSFGQGFNEAGGGVFAHLWNQDGIKIWHFKRSLIPQDITSGNPDPSTWSTPTAFWSNIDCDMATHFIDHSLVIDTTLCGDWAGTAYGSSGCSGTCVQAVSKASNFESPDYSILLGRFVTSARTDYFLFLFELLLPVAGDGALIQKFHTRVWGLRPASGRSEETYFGALGTTKEYQYCDRVRAAACYRDARWVLLYFNLGETSWAIAGGEGGCTTLLQPYLARVIPSQHVWAEPLLRNAIRSSRKFTNLTRLHPRSVPDGLTRPTMGPPSLTFAIIVQRSGSGKPLSWGRNSEMNCQNLSKLHGHVLRNLMPSGASTSSTTSDRKAVVAQRSCGAAWNAYRPVYVF